MSDVDARGNGTSDTATEMGLHTEQLRGRTQQVFFSPSEEENLLYPDSRVVDFDKHAEIDAQKIEAPDVNRRIRELMADGVGSITVRNPGAKHSLGVGVLNRLRLHFDGSLGFCGRIESGLDVTNDLA